MRAGELIVVLGVGQCNVFWGKFADSPWFEPGYRPMVVVQSSVLNRSKWPTVMSLSADIDPKNSRVAGECHGESRRIGVIS